MCSYLENKLILIIVKEHIYHVIEIERKRVEDLFWVHLVEPHNSQDG